VHNIVKIDNCLLRERARTKKRNLLEKKIITDNCLLQEKDNILIYWKDKVCAKK